MKRYERAGYIISKKKMKKKKSNLKECISHFGTKRKKKKSYERARYLRRKGRKRKVTLKS